MNDAHLVSCNLQQVTYIRNVRMQWYTIMIHVFLQHYVYHKYMFIHKI